MPSVVERGFGGAIAPGIHPGEGIQRPSFLLKTVGKCLKMQKNERKMFMAVGIQDKRGIPKILKKKILGKWLKNR